METTETLFRTTLRLPQELERRLKVMAASHRRTLNAEIQVALEEALIEHEGPSYAETVPPLVEAKAEEFRKQATVAAPF